MVKRMMDLIGEARQVITELTVAQLRRRLQASERPILLDVREPHEVEEFGAIEGSVSIPRGFLEMRMEKITTDADAPIVVYCMVGHRSLLAARTLRAMGYRNVASLARSRSEFPDSIGFATTDP